MPQGLTYFVELPGHELQGLLSCPGVIQGLENSQAAVSMAMLDLCDARRDAIRTLNEHNIPTTAWLVLEIDEGYWLTADNALVARERYREVKEWLNANNLRMEAVGLDMEMPYRDMCEMFDHWGRSIFRLFRCRRSHDVIENAAAIYSDLIQEIRKDGRVVETYQFPVILDERRSRSTLLQRIFGFVDMQSDREAIMLYQSMAPRFLDEALIDLFGAECQAIGVGITGGGVSVVLDRIQDRTLDFDQLVRTLRYARRYTSQLYVFSLEGCVSAGFFEKLCEVDIREPLPKLPLSRIVAMARFALRIILRVAG
ncbi:MAG: hypothetical protein V1754_00210 [Pseudomonadota bacterium]